jgi:plastocyanin
LNSTFTFVFNKNFKKGGGVQKRLQESNKLACVLGRKDHRLSGRKYAEVLSFAIVLFLFLVIAGCNKSQTASEQPAPKAANIAVDVATAGTITGVVSFTGTVPKMKPLDMTQDPGCPPLPQPNEAVVLSGNKLANVFVYVKEGLPPGTFAVPAEPVMLDQKGCRYNPHVLGIMVGQPLKITNTDSADHNIHDMPSKNQPFNESQSPTDKPITKTFSTQEIMIPVQCNQHPWMRAYIGVLAHPYFAVSAADGSFAIKNLPPGDYTLAAVHEKFGEQTIKVTVGPKATAKAAFVFTAGQ